MKNFGRKNLIEILIKKASGYFYEEEVYEYEKTQTKHINSEKQLSFNDFTGNLKFDDRVQTNTNNLYDTIKLSDEKTTLPKQEPCNLTLFKKKVTSHYVPPDMLAIKILFEIFGEKVNDNDIKKLTDEELIKLKNKLIGEIKNEDCKNR